MIQEGTDKASVVPPIDHLARNIRELFRRNTSVLFSLIGCHAPVEVCPRAVSMRSVEIQATLPGPLEEQEY